MNQQITEQQAIEERQKYVTAFNDTMIKGVFYKLRDKERSKDSAYVLVAFRFLARPFVSFVSFVSYIARYAPSSTNKRSSL